MILGCERAIKLTLPAARASVAKRLKETYGMNQSEIAKSLGVAQAAVSKYLKSSYSDRVKKIEDAIKRAGLDKPAALAISKSDSRQSIRILDGLASNDSIVKMAMALA